MKNRKARKSSRRAVKDLTAKTAKAVKGGNTASPVLLQACATGEHIKKAVLFV